MADFFLDVSAVGNEYQAYTDTPTTWAVPQDGNGRAGPGHSAAVAIATIDVAGCTASGTGTIGVLGVTVSSTLNASGAALATAIATAINASTTATAAGVCLALLPLNRLVFARVNPGVNTQVQIMLRIAGVDWNGLTPTQANISPAATIGAFAGGANGPFGYWWNTSTVFGKTFSASQNTTPTWGIAYNASGGTLNPTISDPIIVRTRRAGVDLAPPKWSLTSGFVHNWRSRTFVFDNGTTWAGDNGQFTLGTYTTTAGEQCFYVVTAPSRWIARSKYNLRITHGNTNPVGELGIYENGERVGWEVVNVLFDESVETPTATSMAFSNRTNRVVRLVQGCRFKLRGSRFLAGSTDSALSFLVRYFDCDFDFYIAGPTPSGLFRSGNGLAQGEDTLLEFSHCRFTFASGGPITQLMPAGLTLGSAFRLLVTDCTGIRPDTLPGTPGDFSGHRAMVFVGCADAATGAAARSSISDTGHVQRSWFDNGTYPYLASTVPTGAGFSIRAVIKAGRESAVAFEIARLLTMYRAADAARVITAELAVPNGVTFNTTQIYGLITATGSDNAIFQVSTQGDYATTVTGSAVALASSAASWTSAAGYTAVKISFDTASISKQIKANTEVVMRLMYRGNTPGGVDRTIHVSPELVFA